MKDRIVNSSELGVKHGQIPVNYVYTVGVAWESFFREIKDKGQLMAADCLNCGITYLPPHLYCERCFSELESAQSVAARGVVHTFTVVSRDLDDKPLAEPQVWGFVSIDETDGGLVHRILVDPDEVYIGMPVEGEFRPESDRQGAITDILGFRPA